MIRLEKHEELVEATAQALYERRTPGSWATASNWTRAAQRDEAAAALDAMLEAAVRLGVGRRPTVQALTLKLETEPATIGHLDNGKTALAGCPHCGYRHPPDGMCI